MQRSIYRNKRTGAKTQILAIRPRIKRVELHTNVQKYVCMCMVDG